MGSDLSVVNAARVSFSKESKLVWVEDSPTMYKETLSDKDKKLIGYLAKHDHWSPFAHASLQFRIKAPIFVARQLVKHQVGLVWNEVSRRYVDDTPEFYIPTEWRLKAEDKKQGSSDETIEYNIQGAIEFVTQTYNNLLDADVAPEMARMVLPQNLYTEWYWSGTLMAFARICNLRCKPDTQLETQQIAQQIDMLAKEKFPVTWGALRPE
jgi:thymidylate synthase (FAD)|tara:strand:- start:398 stop:1027 length:630 start_codon:yes stop_codon:yes gene_type:complete